MTMATCRFTTIGLALILGLLTGVPGPASATSLTNTGFDSTEKSTIIDSQHISQSKDVSPSSSYSLTGSTSSRTSSNGGSTMESKTVREDGTMRSTPTIRVGAGATVGGIATSTMPGNFSGDLVPENTTSLVGVNSSFVDDNNSTDISPSSSSPRPTFISQGSSQKTPGVDSNMSPIVVKGQYMYNSATKERFVIKGLTYEYAVDDDIYQQYGKKIFTEIISQLGINAVRIYTVNPDLSYNHFMSHMKEMGIYVMVSATPGSDSYFTNYRSCALASNGTTDIDFGSCYPACLLEYGKMVVKRFSVYSNTLGVIVGNEVSRFHMRSLSCVKQYAADLKAWMVAGVNSMRVLPLAYAELDAPPSTAASSADKMTTNDWNVLRAQYLSCDDSYQFGKSTKSIDILMLNSYRYCDKHGQQQYDAIRKYYAGFPGVLAFGEYDCAIKGVTRTWDGSKYLFSKNMWDAFSGGFAYTYGEALLTEEHRIYPIVTGGSSDVTGPPGENITDDFVNLANVYASLSFPQQKGEWERAGQQMCSWSGPNSVPQGNIDWTTTCSDLAIKLSQLTGEDIVWPIDSREGVVCTDSGDVCDVAYPSSSKSSSETALCGGEVPSAPATGGAKRSSAPSGSEPGTLASFFVLLGFALYLA